MELLITVVFKFRIVSKLAAIECLVCGLISKYEFNEHNICGAMFAHGRHCIAWMKSRINN
jgi:hypothetical protein